MAGEGDAERLAVLLEARIRDFERNMQKASGTASRNYDRMRRGSRSATRQMEGDMTRASARINAALASTSSRIGALARSNAMFLAGGLGLGALFGGGLLSSVQSVSSELAKIGDTADRVGIATEELQRLRDVADRTGGSAAALDSGLVQFTRNISLAASGSGELKNVLEANGVALRDSEGRLRSTNDLLMQFADLVRSARNPADQLRLATMAFGQQAGTELVGMLKGGADEVRRLAEEADKAGVVIEDRVVRKAQELDEKFKAVSRTVGTTFKTAVVEVASAVSDFIALLNKINESPRGASVPIEDIGKRVVAINREIMRLEEIRDAARENYERRGAVHDMRRMENYQRRIDLLREEEQLLMGRGHAEVDRRANAPAPSPGGSTVIPSTASPDQQNQFDRAQQRLQQRIELLRVEAETLGRGTQAAEEARAKVELLNAAKAAGLTITPQLTAKVDELAEKWGKAAAEAEQVKDRFQAIEGAAREFGDAVTGAFQGMIVEGKSFNEVLSQMLKNLANSLIREAMQGLLFGPGGRGGGGGLFSMLFRAQGGYISGPGTGTSDSIPAMLSNGEYVVNAKATARHRPLLEAINGGRVPGFAAGGFVSRAPRSAAPAGSSSTSGAQPVDININVTGARGNAEIEKMVESGVKLGIKQFAESRDFEARTVRTVRRGRNGRAL